jgi:exodeoxyribonuclease VII large subunit
MEEHIYSVSEISQEIKSVIERFITPVWVEGEVSNYSLSRAGHIYFSLKDQFALIKCVIWKNIANSIPFQISDGMHLLVYGDITAYSAQSQYQINISEIRAAGLGTLYLAFEALKKKLDKEGLFDESKKKALPKLPRRIGVVTSVTGAAIQDILRISERRNPSIEIVIYPAQVQGEGAADTIVKGIEVFNKLKNVDFIIIGRGGGSLEDLWAFNEEKVVRAIVSSELPIVSAVGHEVDFTLSDFSADLRAPTPSAAAEIAIPKSSDIEENISLTVSRLRQEILHRIRDTQNLLTNYKERLLRKRPLDLIHQRWQRLDELELRLVNSINQHILRIKQNLESLDTTLNALNPREVLRRGFAIVYLLPKKTIVKSIDDVEKDSLVSVEISDGLFNANVKSKKYLRKDNS